MRFKYIWEALFVDKNDRMKIIRQPADDRYSKHDSEAEYNPSSFRDFLDYWEGHKDELLRFALHSEGKSYTVNLINPRKPKIYCDEYSRWGNIKHKILWSEKRPLKDVRIIYFREVEADVVIGEKIKEPRIKSFVLGYQGLDKNGNNRQKTITVL